jgi:hypothetical protein
MLAGPARNTVRIRKSSITAPDRRIVPVAGKRRTPRTAQHMPREIIRKTTSTKNFGWL